MHPYVYSPIKSQPMLLISGSRNFQSWCLVTNLAGGELVWHRTNSARSLLRFMSQEQTIPTNQPTPATLVCVCLCLCVRYLNADRRQGVGQTASFLGDAGAASAAAARVFALVDRRPPIDSADEGGQRLSVVRGAVEFRSVMSCHVMSRHVMSRFCRTGDR